MIAANPSTAQLLLSSFQGRKDVIAIGTDKGFAPHRMSGPLPASWLEQRHLAKVRCLGFYLMDEHSRVMCSCVDFDNKPEHPDPTWQAKAASLYDWLEKLSLGPVMEVSASGRGAHVWLFFEEPTDAWLVRAFWRLAESKVGFAFREVYPRQDRLTGKEIGNLVRFPLWNESRFADPSELDWPTVPPEDALGRLLRTSAAELKQIAFSLGGALQQAHQAVIQEGPDAGLPARVASRLQRKNSLLARRWAGDTQGLKDESRSSLVLSIACELVRQYVPTAEIETAVRYWCEEHDYDKGRRPDWIVRTVGKAYEFTLSRMEERSTDDTNFLEASLAYLDTLERGQSLHISSGIFDVDKSIDGVAAGEMAIIAGRPGHGKTAMALQWVNYATLSGQRCLFISEEMNRLEIGKRLVLSVSALPQEHWSREMIPQLKRDMREHYEGHFPAILRESANSIQRVEQLIDEHVRMNGIGLVVVDYLQLLTGTGESRYEKMSEVSRRLKQALKRNNVAGIACCQLNRDIDHRSQRTPQLSDLKETGQLEQDADLVLFVQWPHLYDSKLNKDEFSIYIRKRRNGPIRRPDIVTKFNPERQYIGEVSRLPGDEP